MFCFSAASCNTGGPEGDGGSDQDVLSVPFTTNNWVYTDRYDRSVAMYEECGPPRDKLVGIFYFIWHSNRSSTVNTTDFFKTNPGGINLLSPGATYYWGEPEDGYYHTNDPWVIRKHLRMLSAAGVDFLYFDTTNGIFEWVYEAVDAIAAAAARLRAEGIEPPKIAFTTHYGQAEIIQSLYDRMYKPGKYRDLWLEWEGKPVIMSPKSSAPSSEIADFFTWRYGWSDWGGALKNSWPWHNIGGYGYTTDTRVAEQMTVSKGSHPTINVGSSYQLGPEGIIQFGADHKDTKGGMQPAVDPDYYNCAETGKGALFEKQWDKVFERDPEVLMITQWNEWIAVCCTQRYCIEVWKNPDMTNSYFLGKALGYDDRYFVDMFNDEYNRDIEPMKGGYGDIAYYRMVNYIRKFKGMEAPMAPSRAKTITIDGDFAEWMSVLPVYTDYKGDIDHRDFVSVNGVTRYTNTTGRNDIIQARVCRDRNNLYMYVSTEKAMTPHTDPNWMLLFIDSDCNRKTGWEGYDFLVNSPVNDEKSTTLKKWDGSEWVLVQDIPFRVSGGEMELSIPLAKLGLDLSDVRFDFHWADNIQNLGDITEFCISGDSAPDRKFNYRYGN